MYLAELGYRNIRFMANIKNLLRYAEENSRFLFAFFFVLVLLDRLNTFLRFSVVYTDSDQLVMWQIAKDLMNGSFHGPCFYGQSYNPVFEPLFALPLLFSGMDLHTALPLVTTLLGVAPFLILSFYLCKKSGPLTGLLPLLLSLLLPPGYSMLTSVSRGFVTGIFFAVTGFVLLVFHRSFFSRLSGGILWGIGIYANPNCVLLLPLIIPFLPYERKELFRTMAPWITGFCLGMSSLVFNAAYYHSHPEMLIHGSPSLKMSFDSFVLVLSRLDNYFTYITPVVWHWGWVSLLLFILTGIRLWRYKRKMEFLSLALLFAAILLSFSVAKVTHGTNSVFFSGSRMFLAYPFILLFLFIFYLNTLPVPRRKNVIFTAVLLSVVAFTVKVMAFDLFLKNALKGTRNSIVKVIPVDTLRTTCEEMLSFANGHADLVVANSSDTPDQPITYGCPCLIPDFPVTIQPLYERRTWILPEILDRVYERVLIHGKDTNAWKRMNLEGLQVIRSDVQKGWMLIENRLRTRDLLHETGIKTIDGTSGNINSIQVRNESIICHHYSRRIDCLRHRRIVPVPEAAGK